MFFTVSNIDWDTDSDYDCLDLPSSVNTFPMWNTMWAFNDPLDAEWAEEHLEEIKKCGFRIYDSEDYGIVIGINGAGYDFYEAHWIPLYDARGFHWHEE